MSYYKFVFGIVLFSITSLIISCEHSEGPTGPGNDLEPTLSSIQTNIFNQSCALSNCHVAPNPPQGLILSEGEAFENLVGVSSREIPRYLRVDPGNPDSSYIIMKLEGSDKIIGQRMPAGRTPLSSEKISIIRQWITNGAER